MALPHALTTRDGIPFVVREATPDDAERLLAGVRQVVAERLPGIVTQPEEFT